MKPKLFINANERLTFLRGSTVYELQTGLGQSTAISDCWSRVTQGEGPYCPPDRRTLERALEALLTADCTVGHRTELESKDDPRMRLLNRPVHCAVNVILDR